MAYKREIAGVITQCLESELPVSGNYAGDRVYATDTGNFWMATSATTWVKTYDSGGVPLSILEASGTPSSSTFLRGDGTWNAPTATAGTLTGATLASGVTASSLTSFGAAPALGTPASGVATNLTGTAAGLTAGAVTVPAALGASTATTQSPADNSTKVATTAYVDNAVLGQNYKEAAKYATTAALASIIYANGTAGAGATLTGVALGALSVDGSSPAVNDRLLIKNQASTFQNGIYKVTATGSGAAVFVLTRTTDADQTTEYATGDSVFVTGGTSNSATTWAYNGIDTPVMGTDAITYVQAAGQGSLSSGNGIAITGNSVAVDTSVTVDKTTAQTLTNKTLTSPAITTPTGIVKGDVGLGNVDNTSDATQNAATATLTNKTLTSPILTTPDIGTATGVKLTLTGTAPSLTLGTSSSATGQIVMKNSTNTNYVSIVTGATSANYSFQLPLAVASAGQVLTDAAGNGVLSWVTQSVPISTGVSGLGTGIATFLATPSGANLAAAVTDETGTGLLVFATNPVLTTPNIGTPSAGTLTNTTGLPIAGLVASTSTALGVGSVELGHATDTTLTRVSAGVVAIEGVNVVDVSSAQTLTTKTLTAPTITAPVMTGAGTADSITYNNNAITASGNAATVPITKRLSTVTNNSAATLTVTMTTTSAVDGQMTIVRILDFSAAAQTITWVNTENSTVTAPVTSNGSTTLPITVGFMYNSGTSKWRCIASA